MTILKFHEKSHYAIIISENCKYLRDCAIASVIQKRKVLKIQQEIFSVAFGKRHLGFGEKSKVGCVKS